MLGGRAPLKVNFSFCQKCLLISEMVVSIIVIIKYSHPDQNPTIADFKEEKIFVTGLLELTIF